MAGCVTRYFQRSLCFSREKKAKLHGDFHDMGIPALFSFAAFRCAVFSSLLSHISSRTGRERPRDSPKKEREISGMSTFVSQGTGDDATTAETTQDFYAEKHAAYVTKIANDTSSFEFVVSQHFRMSGVYWGLTALSVLGVDIKKEMDMVSLLEWLMNCQDPTSGGFGGSVDHDPHILYTLSALQILALTDELHRVNSEHVARFIAGLQQTDGSFFGDQWGEVDTRFSYCALSAMSLLGRLHTGEIDVGKAVEFVGRCKNFDGGFGAVPGAESHAGQIFCCVGALSIGQALHYVDEDLLGWWLSERQCDSGGLNGRPEKQADVCYSWWILSSLSILGRTSWINRDKLKHFILDCQDAEDGGIADRPGNMADIFHSFFGISGLSLLGHFTADKENGRYACYREIDPTYALPKDLVNKLGLQRQILPATIP